MSNTASKAPSQPASPPHAAPVTGAATPASLTGGQAVPQSRKFKKSDLIFSENDTSRAMYFIKSGMIRIFKKKGEGSIEIDTLRAGSVLGELAFLDGNPRSASAEALTEVDLVEVNGPAFQETMNKIPDWLKILMKTIVGRLRAASTRIRQLESNQNSMSYADKDGAKENQYQFLSTPEILKGSAALLLVTARNGTQAGSYFEIKESLFHRYGNQIMNVPIAKLAALLDVFSQCGITTASGNEEKIVVTNPSLLEQFIGYFNDQYLLESSKKTNVSPRGFVVISTLAKHINNYSVDSETGLATVNVGQILKSEEKTTGKIPFRTDEFDELVKLNIATKLQATSSDDITTQIKTSSFLHLYRMQKVILSIYSVNAQKAAAKK
jgi:CRP/FNR family cyclic AMP-dependent transcriptional regulator